MVTDYTLDHWILQNYGLDVNNLPSRWPKEKISRELFDHFREKYKDGVPYVPGSTAKAQELDAYSEGFNFVK